MTWPFLLHVPLTHYVAFLVTNFLLCLVSPSDWPSQTELPSQNLWEPSELSMWVPQVTQLRTGSSEGSPGLGSHPSMEPERALAPSENCTGPPSQNPRKHSPPLGAATGRRSKPKYFWMGWCWFSHTPLSIFSPYSLFPYSNQFLHSLPE